MPRLRMSAMAVALALIASLFAATTASADPVPTPGDNPTVSRPDLPEQQIEVAAQGAAPPQSNVDPKNPYGYTVEEYLTYIIGNLDKAWSGYFAANQFAQPQEEYKIIEPADGAYQSANCPQMGPIEANFPNAFYCPQFVDDSGAFHGGELVLPVTALQKMWTGEILMGRSAKVGDFAAAIITAHEFGHGIQDELWWQWWAKGVQVAEPTGYYKELIADCLAGVWAASAYYDGVLTDTDWEEAEAALYAIGDKPDPMTGKYSTVAPHGKPDDRVEALRSGYFGLQGVTGPGDPNSCVQKYWKQVPVPTPSNQ